MFNGSEEPVYEATVSSDRDVCKLRVSKNHVNLLERSMITGVCTLEHRVENSQSTLYYVL